MANPPHVARNSASITKTGQQQQVTFQASQTPAMVGPLPAPDMMRQYAEMVPNFAERYLAMVEGEQKHRHGFEVKMLEEAAFQSRDMATIAKRGQLLSAAMFAVGLGACMLLAHLGHDWVAGGVAAALGGTGIVALWKSLSRQHDLRTVGLEQSPKNDTAP